MPKIPTFETRARPTEQVSSVRSGIQVSPYASTAAALVEPVRKVAEYYERERMIAEKAEADKAYLELSTELDQIQDQSGKQFNPTEAQRVFQTQSNFLFNEKSNQVQSKRVRQLMKDKFDADLIRRNYKVGQLSRNELDKQTAYNFETDYQLNLSKYRTASNEGEKIMYRNQMFSDLESKALYFGDAPSTKQIDQDNLNKNLFKVDFQRYLDSGNVDAALSVLSDFESTKFLKDSDRQSLQKDLDSKLADVNIDNVIEAGAGIYATAGQVKNVDGTTIKTKDLENGMNRKAQMPNAVPARVIQSSIKNNATVPMYKNIIVGGSANISDTGDRNTTRQGLEYYRLFKIQNGLGILKSTYKIDKETLQSYARIDFAMNVLKEPFDSAFEREVQIKNKPEDFRLRSVKDTEVDKKFNSIDMQGLFDPDIVNVQTTKNLLKNIANMYYKAGGTEDAALDGAKEFIEQNYRTDLFGQIVPRDPSLPEYHDAAIKTYIKKLWDQNLINKKTNEFDDIIPSYYSGGQVGDVQGFILRNKNTGQPIFLGPPDAPLGDFDEVSYDIARLTQKQIAERIYPLAEDEMYKQFVGKYNLLQQKRKRIFELSRPKVESGFGQPVE